MVKKSTLQVFCWSCTSAALKSMTIRSDSTQCHLLRHECPDEDDVDGGNCVLRNGAMFLPLQLNSTKQSPKNFPVYAILKAAFPNLTIDDFRTNAPVLRNLRGQTQDTANVNDETNRKARAKSIQRALVDERAKAYSEPLGPEENACLETMRQAIAAVEGQQEGKNSVHSVNYCALLPEFRGDRVTLSGPKREHLRKNCLTEYAFILDSLGQAMSSKRDYIRVDLDIGKDGCSARDVVIDGLRDWKNSGRPFAVLVLRMCRATTQESAKR